MEIKSYLKRISACMVVTIIIIAVFIERGRAQNTSKADHYRQQVNQGTVGIISGGISGTYIRIATDLAAVLDDNDNHLLRILPIPGKGGVSNIRDLLYLRGIDVAIVQSDILDHIEKNNIFSNIRKRVSYITSLYNAELHIIARKELKSLSELEGKKVNFWHKGSATHITGQNVLQHFGIKVEPVFLDQNKGMELLKSGAIAANMLLVGKPSKAFKLVQETDGLHLLPVNYEGNLIKTYIPSRFSHRDYPGLVRQNQSIQTVASSAVLAVYNWPQNHPRYRKVVRFIDAFFFNFDNFRKKGRHKKWREVNINVRLPGWKRFIYVRNKLAVRGKQREDIVFRFKKFLSESGFANKNLSEQQKRDLFELFQKWYKKRTQ